jgi:hypothetical protein
MKNREKERERNNRERGEEKRKKEHLLLPTTSLRQFRV